jgi:hypothetical protein
LSLADRRRVQPTPEALIAVVLEAIDVLEHFTAGGLHHVGRRLARGHRVSDPARDVGSQPRQMALEQLIHGEFVAARGPVDEPAVELVISHAGCILAETRGRGRLSLLRAARQRSMVSSRATRGPRSGPRESQRRTTRCGWSSRGDRALRGIGIHSGACGVADVTGSASLYPLAGAEWVEVLDSLEAASGAHCAAR